MGRPPRGVCCCARSGPGRPKRRRRNQPGLPYRRIGDRISIMWPIAVTSLATADPPAALGTLWQCRFGREGTSRA